MQTAHASGHSAPVQASAPLAGAVPAGEGVLRFWGLEIYHAQTKPLVDFYGNWAATGDAKAPKVRKVAGVGSVDQITASVFDALK